MGTAICQKRKTATTDARPALAVPERLHVPAGFPADGSVPAQAEVNQRHRKKVSKIILTRSIGRDYLLLL